VAQSRDARSAKRARHSPKGDDGLKDHHPRLRLRVAQPRNSRKQSVPGVALLGEDGLESLVFGRR
jgi:hypothetical protein